MKRMNLLPGQRYQRTKEGLCQIVAMAVDPRTHEPMVVYQSLCDDYQVYACPLEYFDELTSQRHARQPREESLRPNARRIGTQADGIAPRMRDANQWAANSQSESPTRSAAQTHETNQWAANSQSESPTRSATTQAYAPDDGISPMLMQFLDADTYAERYQILSEMAQEVDDHVIDTMAVALDIVIEDGDIDQRYQELKNCIRTRMRYETSRLR